MSSVAGTLRLCASCSKHYFCLIIISKKAMRRLVQLKLAKKSDFYVVRIRVSRRVRLDASVEVRRWQKYLSGEMI